MCKETCRVCYPPRQFDAAEAIRAAKRRVANLPKYRRDRLAADFHRAQLAAQFHATYQRP